MVDVKGSGAREALLADGRPSILRSVSSQCETHSRLSVEKRVRERKEKKKQPGGKVMKEAERLLFLRARSHAERSSRDKEIKGEMRGGGRSCCARKMRREGTETGRPKAGELETRHSWPHRSVPLECWRRGTRDRGDHFDLPPSFFDRGGATGAQDTVRSAQPDRKRGCAICRHALLP